MKNIFFQKYFLHLKKFQNPCYEILGFPQNEQVHFVGNPKFHNSEILVPPESSEKSTFPRFIWNAQASKRFMVKSFRKYRSRRAREMSLVFIGARKRLQREILQKNLKYYRYALRTYLERVI